MYIGEYLAKVKGRVLDIQLAVDCRDNRIYLRGAWSERTEEWVDVSRKLHIILDNIILQRISCKAYQDAAAHMADAAEHRAESIMGR